MWNRFFNSHTKNITSGASILAVSYLISAVLGLFRDRLLASRFGAGPELDVYFAAFRIPDFVYNILISGGLIVAFLPLFSEYFARNKTEAWEMVNYILNALLLLLVFISLILFFLAPWFLSWLFPGFGPEQLKLALSLVRLLFLSPILFGLSNILSGVLQYFGRFFIYGLTPIIYNLGIIFGILVLSPASGILGVGVGVIIGAFLHFAIQIPSARKCGFRYLPLLNFKCPAIKRIFQLMIPRVFGVASQQINLIAITAIASLVGPGAISIFNFSNNLQSLPIALAGTSFAVVIFPALSRAWAENKKEEFIKNFSSVFLRILFLTIPASVLIFIFRSQIIKIILETGRFSVLDTKLAAACLGLFSLSIFAQALILLLARAFFSLQDTKTPTFIAVISVILNIGLALFLTRYFGSPNSAVDFMGSYFGIQGIKNIQILGLPLAFSISAIFQFLLLSKFLSKKLTILKSQE